jgi:nucleoside phosphorylase
MSYTRRTLVRVRDEFQAASRQGPKLYHAMYRFRGVTQIHPNAVPPHCGGPCIRALVDGFEAAFFYREPGTTFCRSQLTDFFRLAEAATRCIDPLTLPPYPPDDGTHLRALLDLPGDLRDQWLSAVYRLAWKHPGALLRAKPCFNGEWTGSELLYARNLLNECTPGATWEVCVPLSPDVFLASALAIDLLLEDPESEADTKASASLPAVDCLPGYNVEDQPWWAPLSPTRHVPSEELVSLAGDIDIILLTATDTEIEAVLRRLEPYPKWGAVLKGFIGQETYYLGRFGSCFAAVTKCRMGSLDSGAATLATDHGQRVWRPKAVIMVGIALGKDPTSQKIADVLVASQVISYEPQRVGATHVVSRGPITPANTTLLNRLENVPHWSFVRPDGSKCERYVGPLLSGEKLVDDPAFKAELFARYPQAIGGDMEGVGLMAAAVRHGLPWIVVKAICDWADGKKHKKHQALAAASAASLVHHALSQADVLHGLGKLNQSDGDWLKQLPDGAADVNAALREMQRRVVEAQDRFPREVSFALVMIPHDERQAWKAARKWFDDGERCVAFATDGDTPETITIPASERDDGGESPLLYALDCWRCWLLKRTPTAPHPETALNTFYSLAVDACRFLDLRACGMILEGRHFPGSRGKYQHLLRWCVEQLDPEECPKLTWLDPPREHIRTTVHPGQRPRRWMVEMPCVFAAVAHALERHIGGLGKPWPSA